MFLELVLPSCAMGAGRTSPSTVWLLSAIPATLCCALSARAMSTCSCTPTTSGSCVAASISTQCDWALLLVAVMLSFLLLFGPFLEEFLAHRRGSRGRALRR